MYKRSKRTVLVLGCGPAGLLAALAAERLGYNVEIVSRKVKSGMYGAQYLHKPIPGLTEDAGTPIKYVLRGDAVGYATKVYGKPQMAREVSPSLLVGEHPAWNIRSAYDRLWERFEDRILHQTNISVYDMHSFATNNTYHKIVSSLPADRLCGDDNAHYFTSEEVWASGDAPDQDRWAPFKSTPWTVICDGTGDVSWYRASNVFGHNTVEWATENRPPVENCSLVTKPLRTNCDCWKGRVVRVGRYGEWRKGVLAHEAYEKIVGKL